MKDWAHSLTLKCTFLSDSFHPFFCQIHPDSESDEKLLIRAEELLQQLEIPAHALLAHSYFEMFLKGQEKREESDESAFSDESVP